MRIENSSVFYTNAGLTICSNARVMLQSTSANDAIFGSNGFSVHVFRFSTGCVVRAYPEDTITDQMIEGLKSIGFDPCTDTETDGVYFRKYVELGKAESVTPLTPVLPPASIKGLTVIPTSSQVVTPTPTVRKCCETKCLTDYCSACAILGGE